MDQALYRTYRPKTFDAVIGQLAIVNSLINVVKRKKSQAFLFFGPHGVGKTTLARITLRELGCHEHDILEKSGSEETGIDDMRQILETMRYRPFGNADIRGIILDECHQLSQKAWDSLLKAVEEPDKHVVWVFCTTRIDKVPKTIQSRCASYGLKLINDEGIRKIIKSVQAKEKIILASGTTDLIVHQAKGSARDALTFLEQVRDCKTKQEAAEIIRAILETNPVRELCQLFLNQGSWAKAMSLVEQVKDESPESIRIQILNYLGAVLKNTKTDDKAVGLLQLIENFTTPYASYENIAPLLVSIGRSLFSE